MALVLEVIAFSSKLTSILYESGSISTNTGFAPSKAITSTVAKKLKGVVITSSPGPISNAISAINNASVPLETAMVCSTPTNSESKVSSSPTSGPIT